MDQSTTKRAQPRLECPYLPHAMDTLALYVDLSWKHPTQNLAMHANRRPHPQTQWGGKSPHSRPGVS